MVHTEVPVCLSLELMAHNCTAKGVQHTAQTHYLASEDHRQVLLCGVVHVQALLQYSHSVLMQYTTAHDISTRLQLAGSVVLQLANVLHQHRDVLLCQAVLAAVR